MLVKQERQIRREKRHLRIRKGMLGVAERPRLSVYRSHLHIYAQIINDLEGKTLLAVSSVSKPLKDSVRYGGNVQAAEKVGEKLAEEAKRLGISEVVFDRAGYKYHGRVKALAEAARKGGLVF